MPDDPLLSSGEFARRSRLSPKALRLYEQQGLLVPDEIDAVNRFRRYRAGRLADARLIVWLRRLDMSLADVARVLAAPPAERSDLVAAYWAAAEERFAAQRHLAAYVRDLASGRTGLTGLFSPEGGFLAEQCHVTPEPVEVCVPIDPAAAAGLDAPSRVEAAHREVYFAAWDASGPEDEVCDVACPL